MAKKLLPEDFYKDGKTRPLIIGDSFYKDGDNEFLSVNYDFKPSLGGLNTTLEINDDNKVTISVQPEGAEDATVYKGSAQPAHKDAFLIIDRETGEIRLEKVSRVVRVKRTRKAGAGGSSARQRATTPDASSTQYSTPSAASDSMPDLDFAEDEDSRSSAASHKTADDSRCSAPTYRTPEKHFMPGLAKDSAAEPNLSSSSSSSNSDSDSDNGGSRSSAHSHNNNELPNSVVLNDLDLSSDDDR